MRDRAAPVMLAGGFSVAALGFGPGLPVCRRGGGAAGWLGVRIGLRGQGAFADCARGLAAIDGLRDAVLAGADGGKPFLGICVGMQLMAARGLEHAVTPGFGWIAGDIAEMTPPPELRLPQ